MAKIKENMVDSIDGRSEYLPWDTTDEGGKRKIIVELSFQTLRETANPAWVFQYWTLSCKNYYNSLTSW